jgi:hypothetical protein
MLLMRHLLRLSIATLFALTVSAGSASAATTAAQLIELSRAGLSDDILVALIQTDGSIFQLTASEILALHKAGLSDKVILAMAETAKKIQPAPAPRVDQDAAESRPAQQPAPPTVINNVTQHVTQTVEQPRQRQDYPYHSVPVYLPTPVAPRVEPPVYWGFGGQRRPDSWDDRPAPKPADTKPTDPKRDH